MQQRRICNDEVVIKIIKTTIITIKDSLKCSRTEKTPKNPRSITSPIPIKTIYRNEIKSIKSIEIQKITFIMIFYSPYYKEYSSIIKESKRSNHFIKPIVRNRSIIGQ